MFAIFIRTVDLSESLLLFFTFSVIRLSLGMSVVDLGSEKMIADLRESMEAEIRNAINDALKDVLSGKTFEMKTIPLMTDKVLFDAFSREVETTVSATADNLAQRLDRVLSDKLESLRAAVNRSNNHSSQVAEKLRILQSKIAQLEAELKQYN